MFVVWILEPFGPEILAAKAQEQLEHRLQEPVLGCGEGSSTELRSRLQRERQLFARLGPQQVLDRHTACRVEVAE